MFHLLIIKKDLLMKKMMKHQLLLKYEDSKVRKPRMQKYSQALKQ